MSEAPRFGRDEIAEIAEMAVRDAREIVGLVDGADEIIASGTEGGLFLLGLGMLALEQQVNELGGRIAELEARLRLHGLPTDLRAVGQTGPARRAGSLTAATAQPTRARPARTLEAR